MKVQLGSNIENKNIKNEILGTQVRKEINFRGQKGQLPVIISISWVFLDNFELPFSFMAIFLVVTLIFISKVSWYLHELLILQITP